MAREASDGTDRTGGRHASRVLAALGVAVLPWTVVVTGSHVDLFFAFGLVPVDPPGLTTVVDFYFRFTTTLPGYLNAWGLGVVLYAVGLVSALLGLVSDRLALGVGEDRRITASMYLFAGFGQLVFAVGFLRRPGYVAVPLGTALLWGLVWWRYRRDLWSIFQFPDGTE